MRTTLKDIAKATGVSVATVSLVLNDKPHQIAADTRERIKRVAEEMQYIPNQAARGLLSKQTKMIAFICEGVTAPYYLYLSQKIQYKALEEGYSVLPYFINGRDNLEEIIYCICQTGVQGIVLLGNTCLKAEKMLKRIKQLKMQVVLLETAYPTHDVDTVLASREQGIYMAVSYLVGKGHTKIGCITGGATNILANDSVSGYKKALQAHHIPEESCFIYEGNYRILSGEQGAEYLLQQGVTAIIAMNEAMAYGVHRKIKEKGIAISDNFEVVSYNNIVAPEDMVLPFTAVEHPLQEMAEYAVVRLIQQVESSKKLRPVTYRYQPHVVEKQNNQ